VLIGTRLDHTIIMRYGWIVLVYIIARSVGKWGGAFVGGRLSNAIPTVQKYLGLALFSQAGVAIGLALAAAKSLERYGLHDYANEIISVITATTFIVMLIGPVFAKIALFKSGEARVKE
jgi:Kef-type K+ transport system membrane component KefB